MSLIGKRSKSLPVLDQFILMKTISANSGFLTHCLGTVAGILYWTSSLVLRRTIINHLGTLFRIGICCVHHPSCMRTAKHRGSKTTTFETAPSLNVFRKSGFPVQSIYCICINGVMLNNPLQHHHFDVLLYSVQGA